MFDDPLLKVGYDHGPFIGRPMKAVFEPLDGSSAMSSKAVDIFAVAAVTVRRRGKSFAFDRK
ncbi:MAG: hypothetical protein BGO12_04510 [Verrucomicrobia bacterium 61-8]|nr:MAG: hypothetical protein BGO12_04510 [Verrucomicrobia bacterium 61-8]